MSLKKRVEDECLKVLALHFLLFLPKCTFIQCQWRCEQSLLMCRTFFACNYGQCRSLTQNVNHFCFFFFSRVSAQKSCQNNTSTSLQVFCLLICFFTCLSGFVLIPLWGRNVWDRLHQGLFRPHLWLLLHRSPSFPPFPVRLLFLLAFQKHPGLSLHLLICSETILSTRFQPSFMVLFIPLFFHLPLWSSCWLAK